VVLDSGYFFCKKAVRLCKAKAEPVVAIPGIACSLKVLRFVSGARHRYFWLAPQGEVGSNPAPMSECSLKVCFCVVEIRVTSSKRNTPDRLFPLDDFVPGVENDFTFNRLARVRFP
jgi:hypothetical protein